MEGTLFSVEEFDRLTGPSNLQFEQVALWVRMYDLPLACMGQEVGRQIGSSMGTIEEVETNEEGLGWRKYLRVKVRLDIRKPIPHG